MKYLGIRYAIADTDVKIIPWVISDKAKEDLLKLADYLYDLPDDYEHFSMFMYLFDGSSHSYSFYNTPIVRNLFSVLTTCGTVACAAGHAPLAGIDCDRFEQYQDLTDWLTNRSPSAYEWMFSGEWASVDDTPKGAAARIYFALEQGIPVNPRSFALGDNYPPYVAL